ncbi:hypothetical protein RHSIM_Rhsim05G0029100 [Rhododendron simsii]|uniref:Uncharacterized protein n=1 Tax=Rhododendron simsii TaxID=118357 RepID=A0A834LPI9_RHOSS|nr:hypothetical protein RHSIM_Rhsim05G0029100 [Rhododendron simsii]
MNGVEKVGDGGGDRGVRAPVTSVADGNGGVGIVSTISTILWAQNDFMIRFPSKSPSLENAETKRGRVVVCVAVESVYQRDKKRERERGSRRRRLELGCWVLLICLGPWLADLPELC